MNKLFKLQLKNVSRDTTRAEWKVISRWLRKAANIVAVRTEQALHDLVVYGITPPELAGELNLLRRYKQYQGCEMPQLDKLRKSMFNLFVKEPK